MRQFRTGDVVITVARKHAIRSVEANRYYRFALTLISEHTGHSVDELHEWAKAKFLPAQHLAICDGNGEIKDELTVGGTTTTLNSVEFYEFVEAIRQFAAQELDVDIPDPDPEWKEHGREAAQHSAEG